MKCLVIGAGGVGGSLAALLALAGNEVTCVARGEHKEKMLAHGLRFHSGIKGEQVVPCYVYDGTEERPGEIGVATAETYRGKAELILVCVKGIPSIPWRIASSVLRVSVPWCCPS